MTLLMTTTSWPNSNAKTYALEMVKMSDFPRTVMFAPPFHAHAPGWGDIGDTGRGLLYPIFERQRNHLMLVLLDPTYLFLSKQTEAAWEDIDPSVAEAATKVFGKQVELVQLQ